MVADFLPYHLDGTKFTVKVLSQAVEGLGDLKCLSDRLLVRMSRL